MKFRNSGAAVERMPAEDGPRAWKVPGGHCGDPGKKSLGRNLNSSFGNGGDIKREMNQKFPGYDARERRGIRGGEQVC